MEELIQRAGYLRHISRTRTADILQWFVQSRVIAFGYFQMFPAFGSPYANQTSKTRSENVFCHRLLLRDRDVLNTTLILRK